LRLIERGKSARSGCSVPTPYRAARSAWSV